MNISASTLDRHLTYYQGNRVPAGIRIVQASSDLRFDRSLLTGESFAV
jgi:magnesium-transporting ATPase (P-type)